MKPARETNHPISSLPPHPEKKEKKMNTGLLCPILSVNANSNADMHCHACTPVTGRYFSLSVHEFEPLDSPKSELDLVLPQMDVIIK